MEGDDTFVREEALEEQEGNASGPSVNDHTTFGQRARNLHRSPSTDFAAEPPVIEEQDECSRPISC
jgi:hypothetical protein